MYILHIKCSLQIHIHELVNGRNLFGTPFLTFENFVKDYPDFFLNLSMIDCINFRQVFCVFHLVKQSTDSGSAVF